MHDFYYYFWDEKKFPGFKRALLELERRSVIKFNSYSHTALERKQYSTMLNKSLDNIEKYFCALIKQKYIKKKEKKRQTKEKLQIYLHSEKIKLMRKLDLIY